MRYALIDDDRVVTNIIEIGPEIAPEFGALYVGEHRVGIGDIYPENELEPIPDIDYLKSTRITTTKTALEAYLESHPLQWTDGKHYSVTAEKQALLNNALAVYQIGVQAGQAPELTWNATTEECTEWEFEGLCALALAIAAYVKPLVAHQQALEVMIRAAQTAEEVESIVIDYAAAG